MLKNVDSNIKVFKQILFCFQYLLRMALMPNMQKYVPKTLTYGYNKQS